MNQKKREKAEAEGKRERDSTWHTNPEVREDSSLVPGVPKWIKNLWKGMPIEEV